jgi:hypothetical protein
MKHTRDIPEAQDRDGNGIGELLTMKHTPGPWTYDGIYVESLDLDKPLSICTLAVSKHKDANARLIAAAPRMLEALRVIEGAEVDDYGDRIITPSEMTIIRAAIAEAE